MIATFLQQLASRILFNDKPLHEILVLLPSKRACYILENELVAQSINSVFAPTILSIEDFIIILSEKRKGEMLPMVYQLYQLLKESNLEFDAELTFEKFLSLGQMLLQDFSDIREHVDAEQYNEVFTYLTEYKKMALWNIDILTDFEKKYIQSWNQMEQVFIKQGEWMNEKDLYDKGAIVDLAMQNSTTTPFLQAFSKVYIAGFNAINKKDGNLFLALEQRTKVEFVWDIDKHYFENKSNEAGDFLRKNSSLFPMESANFSDFFHSNKKIDIIGSSGNVQQIELTIQFLRKLRQESKLESTLIVLNDETLLSPLLHALDSDLIEAAGGLNVTMGWRMQNLFLYQLIFRFLDLHTKKCDFNKMNSYHYNDIYTLLQSFPDFIDDKSVLNLNLLINQNSSVYYSFDQLKNIFELEKIVVKDIFYNLINFELKPISFLNEVLAFLSDPHLMKSQSSLEETGYLQLSKELKNIKLFFEKNELQLSYRLLQWIFEKQVSKVSIPLDGEATRGLQIMGMLETRNLDFENVIMLNVNEGVLPSGKLPKSTIPFEARSLYQIPDHYQQDAVFAYHFIRILQRADCILLMYNALKDDKQGGECSRFITQLEHELPHTCKISHTLHASPIVLKNRSKIELEKTEEVYRNIKQHFQYLNDNKFLSFTAMNELYMCPLKYYWNRVLKIRKPILPFESTDSSSFGTIVHEVLEDIYTPILGISIDPKDLLYTEDRIRELVKSKFLTQLPQAELGVGKNLLLLEKAILQIKNVLKSDLENLNYCIKNQVDFRILKLEAEFKTELILKDEMPILIGGVADRIQKKNDWIEICDYKTGKYDLSKIKITEIEDLDLSEKKYARQLLHYLILIKDNTDWDADKCRAGIFYLNSIKEGLNLLEIKPKNKTNDFVENDVLNEYKNKCISKIEDFLNPEIRILQTHDKSECNYCDFNNICN